ncbi:hypothetical protein BDR05DRAFT_978879 [Suillus weaverae]|nr:hypothetical protein BDR05DRAFT_978879 [Suillus weaverae]
MGHYGNAISNEDVCQWVGVRIGSITNCTNHIMIALFEHHDRFIFFPKYVLKIYPQWHNGIFTTDSSMINLCNKPGLYGETFFSRKSDYSLNCQVVAIPHNLLIVNYSIGHVGSAHDAYAFHSTCIYQDHEALLGDDHWIWANSAYPLELSCIMPFKKLRNGVSKVHIHIEHVFVTLKGRFQSLCKLWHLIQTEKHLECTSYWIMCCLILHNMGRMGLKRNKRRMLNQ